MEMFFVIKINKNELKDLVASVIPNSNSIDDWNFDKKNSELTFSWHNVKFSVSLELKVYSINGTTKTQDKFCFFIEDLLANKLRENNEEIKFIVCSDKNVVSLTNMIYRWKEKNNVDIIDVSSPSVCSSINESGHYFTEFAVTVKYRNK